MRSDLNPHTTSVFDVIMHSAGAEADANTCEKTEVGELPQSVAQATAPQPRPPAAGTGLQLKQQIGSVGQRAKRPPNVPLQLQVHSTQQHGAQLQRSWRPYQMLPRSEISRGSKQIRCF